MAMRRRKAGHDLIVVGGGLAGLTAATHAVRLGMKVLLLEKEMLFGGQVANIEAIDGLYGATEAVSGTALATDLAERLRDAGAEIVHEGARALEDEGKNLRVVAESGAHEGGAVILATGQRLRRLGVPGEEHLYGRGVSQCPACDGGFFRGEDVVVVGGGDAALQEALTLLDICRTVTLVVRGRLRAKRSYVERITAHENARFVWNATVDAIAGESTVSGVAVRDLATGETRDIPCTGVFPFIGSEPDTGWLPEDLPRDEAGRLETDGLQVRGRPNIFAAGAVRSGYDGQIATAIGDGVSAVEAVTRARP